jgi:hypothetical protein
MATPDSTGFQGSGVYRWINRGKEGVDDQG